MDKIILGSYLYKRTQNDNATKKQNYANKFVFYSSCSGSLVVGDKTFEIKPNTFSILPANTPYYENYTNDSTIYCINFVCDDLPLTAGLYEDDLSESFKTIAYQIWQEYHNDYSEKEKMLELLGQKFLIMLRRKASAPELKIKDLSYAKKYIEENYHLKISLVKLANNCGFSYDYFRHKFKELYSVSPQQHLINTRLNSAKNILENSSIKCKETAYLCGFSDASQFSNMYKKKFGSLPKYDKIKK